MTTRIWRGDAVAVSQVLRISPSAATSGRTYALDINGKRISVDGTGSVSALCTAFATAIAATDIPEWREVLAEAAGETLTLTGAVPGMPFTVTGVAGGFKINAVFRITLGHNPGGNWTAEYDGQTTGSLAATISGPDLQTELAGLSSIGTGNVSVVKTVHPTSGDPCWEVELIGVFAGQSVGPLTADRSGLTGGDAELVITVEQEAIAGTDEEQTATFYGSPSGGSSTWYFRGSSSAPVAHNATGATVEGILEAMPTVGAGNVSVSGSAGGPYLITGQGDLAHQALPLIEIDATGLTGGTISASIVTTTPGVAGTNETQFVRLATSGALDELVSFSTTGTVSGGTFKFVRGGEESAEVAWNAACHLLAAALDDLYYDNSSVYNKGNIQPYIDGDTRTPQGGATLQYWGNLGARDHGSGTGFNLPTINSTGLTGGGSYSLQSDLNGIYNDVPHPSATTFRFLFGGATSAQLSATSSAAQVQSALEGMPTIGSGNVLVTGLGYSGANGQDSYSLWRIDFIGALKGTNVALLQVTDLATAMTTGGWTFEIKARTHGVAGTNEVHTLSVAGTPSAGSLTLARGNDVADAIAYDDTASEVQTKLQTITALAGNVACTGGPLPGTPVVITYVNDLSFTDVPLLTLNDNGLKVQVVETTPGVTGQNEIVRFSLQGQDVWAGTLTTTFNAHTTAALDWDSTAAEVVTGLEGLSDFAPGDLVGTGGPWPETDILIELTGAFAETNVGAFTATESLKNGTLMVEAFEPMLLETVTAATGPNHVNDPVNWTGGEIPQPGDVMVLSEGRVEILYGLRQRTSFVADPTRDLLTGLDADFVEGQAVHVWTSSILPGGLSASTLYYIRNWNPDARQCQLSATRGGAPLDITTAGFGEHQIGIRISKIFQSANYTGMVGLPRWSDGDYWEYRQRALKIGVLPAGEKLVIIGQGEGSGCSRFILDTGDDEVTIEVLNTGGSREPNTPPFIWQGSEIDNRVRVFGGEVGIAFFEEDTATIDLLEVRGGMVYLGDVTLETLDRTGGEVRTIDSATLNGTLKLRG